MQESDRQMLLEYWITQMLLGQSLPLSFIRPLGRDEALVAFLLPIAESLIAEADCQVTFDPGPPCEVQFEFIRDEQINTVIVSFNEESNSQVVDLQLAVEQVDRFWLFVSEENKQGINLYEVAWNPVSG